MNTKYRYIIVITTAFALVAVLLCMVKQQKDRNWSEQESSNNCAPICSVEIESATKSKENFRFEVNIAGEEYPVFFEGQDISTELKQTIISDLALNMSHYDSITFMELSSERVEPAAQIYERKVTHWLDEGNQKRWFPDTVERYFGGAVKVGNKYQLIIHEKLIKEYEQALELKRQHVAMFSKLDDFIDLLQDHKKLEEIAQDAKTIRSKLYFYNRNPPSTGEEYKKLITSCTNLWIRHPSLLEVKSLGEVVMQDALGSSDIFAFFTLVSDNQRNPKYMMKIPMGAYVNGKWRILVMPTP